MKKYLFILGTGLQKTLVYRVNFLVRAVFTLVPLMAVIQLWRTIYSGKGEVGGYALAEMISYYLVVMVVDGLTAVTDDDWEIAADIRDGRISQFLLKPIDYLLYRVALFASGRVMYISVAIFPIAIFIAVQHRYFVWPSGGLHWVLFGVSVVLSGLLQFLMSYSLALMSFWLLEVSTLIFIVFALEYVAAGHLFPLDILPAAVERVLYWTPFPYLLYFPVSVYLGKQEGAELWWGMFMQVFWVGLAYLAARWVWARGIRHYSAVGG